ncbi:hypothetical protein EPI10_020849 [Gossypium australe]|uniref:Uncharacterized protein n=1 Tax=Gossypium australe TaxID=47621 RepID=A0A5B6WFH8_9ROSI|nr:hypothetical protein EPI10_020849 [Gossypium australe]
MKNARLLPPRVSTMKQASGAIEAAEGIPDETNKMSPTITSKGAISLKSAGKMKQSRFTFMVVMKVDEHEGNFKLWDT